MSYVTSNSHVQISTACYTLLTNQERNVHVHVCYKSGAHFATRKKMSKNIRSISISFNYPIGVYALELTWL